MAEIHEMSAVELGIAIQARSLSAAEIASHFLNQIERLNDALGAFVTVTEKIALDEARLADERAAMREPASLVDGVPIAVKDLGKISGVRTMYGSRAFADNVATDDDQTIVQLRSAGLVNLGKTNVPEFGLTCYTESNVAPPARCPFNTEIGAGGSSGGAAVAVAAGMLPVALGTDGGGSIRIPASINGLVGHKTSRGLIARSVSSSDPATLSCSGPIARRVEDAAAVLDALVGSHDRYMRAARRPPERLRIARYSDNMYGVSVDVECVRIWEKVSMALEKLGHEIVDIKCPASSDVANAYLATWCIGAAAIDVPREHEDLLTPMTQMLRERGRGFSDEAKHDVLVRLKLAAENALSATNAFDAVITPTLGQRPLPVGAIRNDSDPQRDLEAQCEFTPFTSLYNITGQPAISVPAGLSEEGLPIGVQLAGRSGGDAELISLASQLEGVL